MKQWQLTLEPDARDPHGLRYRWHMFDSGQAMTYVDDPPIAQLHDQLYIYYPDYSPGQLLHLSRSPIGSGTFLGSGSYYPCSPYMSGRGYTMSRTGSFWFSIILGQRSADLQMSVELPRAESDWGTAVRVSEMQALVA